MLLPCARSPQFVTMDAIANVYYPLVMAKPLLIIYFLPLLMCLACAKRDMLQRTATVDLLWSRAEGGAFHGGLEVFVHRPHELGDGCTCSALREKTHQNRHEPPRLPCVTSLLGSHIGSRDPCGTFYHCIGKKTWDV